MRKSERDVTVPVSGGPTHTNFGRTAESSDSDVVAPTADPEIGLDKAGALSKTKGMVDPGSPEGPRRKAVAITGAQSGARTQGNVTEKSIPKGFRTRDIEGDSTAASFTFNNVVGELRAKLDSRERLLRLVDAAKDGDDREGVAARNPIAGTAEDWESLLLRK